MNNKDKNKKQKRFGASPGITSNLRQRAEDLAVEQAQCAINKRDTMTEEEVQQVLHELDVHQIELEMQNEELRWAQLELDGVRARYFDLYDLAPVGYCTVSTNGVIVEANLMADILFGMGRRLLKTKKVSELITKEDQDIYYLHHKQLFESEDRQECELRMLKKDGSIFWAHLAATAVHDEKGRLVARMVINDVTARKNTENQLRVSEEKYRLITENASDVISVFNLTKDEYTYISPAIVELRGLTVEEAIKESIDTGLTPKASLILKKSIEKNSKEFIDNPDNPKNYVNEIYQSHKKGDFVWVELSTRYRYSVDGDIEIVCVSRNSSERKKAEKERNYAIYHDYLTDLYNRRFYEEALVKLDTKINLPITLVMSDVNGLKLINDSFGHTMGDELLKKAAELIKIGCRTNDIAARLGGDEFVIILPKTSAFEAAQIIKSIKSNVSNEKVGAFKLSISFGQGTKNLEQENIQGIFKDAEDEMYRHKLYESASIRSKTIDLIMNTLYEKSRREMMHSKRVCKLCKGIATKMNFDQDAINQIMIAGLIHDIGKMGVEENILNKSGILNADEWKEIRKHPETGYRILSSVNEFSEMAKYVLEHHERWDGNGYPKGLKGTEISLQARIIGIADAYDAMTSDRSYRKGLSKEEAIKEIKLNSGTQFDPEIVKVFLENYLPDLSD
ncbi:MAG: HD domain-containing phosphohydrolase [Acetobacterium sp.]